MTRIRTFIRSQPVFLGLLGVILLLTALPFIDTQLVLGNSWQGIYPTFTDELNFARVHTIGEGHVSAGNAYYLEHSDGPPLVIFGGAWLNAIPLWAGLSFNTALVLNFIVWSLLFAASLYWLLRELRVSPWVSAISTVLLYLESYAHVWRPVNLQPVFPFYFLFYTALMRLLRDQSRRNIALLGVTIGATFYIFAYLWQIVVITMGLLCLYALIRKNWSLFRGALWSSLIGGLVGLPVLLYIFWLAHSSPYFWETMGRMGLVNSHLPMAEVIYSGGWIGLVFLLLGVAYVRARELFADRELGFMSVFIVTTGLGLWIMQGSNIITGKLSETGEHVRVLILPWLIFVTVGLGSLLWTNRAQISPTWRIFAGTVIAILTVANGYYIGYYFSPLINIEGNSELWHTEQLYVKPLAWIDSQQEEPVVIWSDPHDHLASLLPIYSRDFALDSYWGMLELVPEGEIRERYLVSQYFNNPTLADLKSEAEMGLYLGRGDLFHKPATHNRAVKVCQLVFFWDKTKDCGISTTPQDMLGDSVFSALEDRFQNDIRPHIKVYLAKYHVSYIIKDTLLNPTYRPEMLGAKKVYTDERFEIYHL